MRIFLKRPAVVLRDETIEHHRAEAAPGDSADGEQMSREIRVRVLKPAQNNSGPVSGANSAAFGCHDVERMRRGKLLNTRPPVFERGDNAVPLDRARRHSANPMIVVPRAKKNRQNYECGDDGKPPARAEKNEETSERDPRRCGDEENSAHSDFLRNDDGSESE